MLPWRCFQICLLPETCTHRLCCCLSFCLLHKFCIFAALNMLLAPGYLVFPKGQFFQVYSWRKTFITFLFLLFKHESCFPWPYLTLICIAHGFFVSLWPYPRFPHLFLLFQQLIICLNLHAVCCTQSPVTCLPDHSFSVPSF